MTKEDPLSDTQPSGRRARLTGLPGSAAIIAIGAGTGGPPTIQEILRPMCGPLPPIVVVQELEPEYQRGFVAWLDDSTELRVRLAADGDELAPGHVYIAPHQGQIVLTKSWQLAIEAAAPPRGSKCRVDRFFESVAQHAGQRAVGIVLTGIGCDGSKGLLAVRAHGGTTLAQTEATSVVASMPRAAVDSGAARATASPDEIAGYLSFLTWVPMASHAVVHEALACP